MAREFGVPAAQRTLGGDADAVGRSKARIDADRSMRLIVATTVSGIAAFDRENGLIATRKQATGIIYGTITERGLRYGLAVKTETPFSFIMGGLRTNT
jgi:hypothetical protein